MEEVETAHIFKYNKQMIAKITDQHERINYQKAVKSGLWKTLCTRQTQLETIMEESQQKSLGEKIV